MGPAIPEALMNRLLIVAILMLSTTPLYAQRQQHDAAKLKADARNVVGTIANDKAKIQAYCQTLDLARQLERADQEKDRKKITVLSEKINQLQKLVGPEFLTLVNILKHLDLNSPDGREIASIIQSLNQSCPD
jgi:predicted lipoprotein